MSKLWVWYHPYDNQLYVLAEVSDLIEMAFRYNMGLVVIGEF